MDLKTAREFFSRKPKEPEKKTRQIPKINRWAGRLCPSCGKPSELICYCGEEEQNHGSGMDPPHTFIPMPCQHCGAELR